MKKRPTTSLSLRWYLPYQQALAKFVHLHLLWQCENVFGDKLNGVSNATRRKNTRSSEEKNKKKYQRTCKKSLGASQLLFDGGLFILSNLGNLCGALEGLVKAPEFGDKKGTKRRFPRTSTDKGPYLAKEVSDYDEKGCGERSTNSMVNPNLKVKVFDLLL